MSAADERVNSLHVSAEKVRDFYASQGQDDMAVTLFAEDFDWLLKRKAITAVPGDLYYFGLIKVRRGYRKKKARRRRPKETML